MGSGPTFKSGGFLRGQDNAVSVVNPDGTWITAGGGGGGGGPISFTDATATPTAVAAPGTAARGLLVDPYNTRVDGDVVAPSTKVLYVVGGSDGSNYRAVKTSAAGVVQVDVLSVPSSAATSANQATEITRLTEIRDRLPSALNLDGGLPVHVQNPGSSGGADVQYADGATQAAPTGNVILWLDASNVLRAPSATKPLPVAQQGTATVTGSVNVSNTPTVDTELTTADLDTGVGTDTRAVVGLARAESGGATLVGSANPLPVSGSVSVSNFPAAQPVTDNNGSITVDAPVGTPLATRLSDGTAFLTTTAGRLAVDGSGVTQPVSGTVTANVGTTNGLALDATLTGGTQKAVARTAAKGTTVAADLTSNPVDANTQALHVTLAGTQASVPVTGTFWQATQPVSAASLPLPTSAAQEHATAASPHSTRLSDGTAFYDAAKTGQLPAALDASGGLKAAVVAALPAGTNSIGTVQPQFPLSQSIDGTGAAQPFQFAYANVSTAQTAASLIAAPAAGRSIRVISYAVVVGAAMNVSLIGASTTLLFPLAANGGVSFAGSLQGPAFQVAAATALTWTTSAAGQATIHITYVIV